MSPLLILKPTRANAESNTNRDWVNWFLTFIFFTLLVGRNLFNKPLLALALLFYLVFSIDKLRQSLILFTKSLSLIPFWTLFLMSYFWTVVPKVTLDIILTQSAFLVLVCCISLRHELHGFIKPLRIAIFLLLPIVLLYCLAFPHASYSAAGLNAFYPQKNNLGVMMALCALVLLHSTDKTWLHIVFGCIAMALLVASQSKTSIALVLICSSILPLVGWVVKSVFKETRQILFKDVLRSVLLVFILVCLLAMVVFRDEIFDFILANLPKTAFTGRGTLWLTVIYQIKAHSLLGIGPGVFWQSGAASEIAQTSLYKFDPFWVQQMVSSDGSYIDLVSSLGVLGLAFFLLSAVDLYRRLFRHWHQPDSKMMFVLVTFVLLHAITESTILYSTNILWMTYLLCYFRVVGFDMDLANKVKKRKLI